MTSKVSRYRAIPLDEFFKGSQPLPSCWWWWAAMRPLWHTAIRICRTGADVQNCANLCKWFCLSFQATLKSNGL